MRGVSFIKSRGTWRVRYGKSISETFHSKEQAISRRKELEARYGMPNARSLKSYSNFENQHFKILGSTGETDSSGRQKVLALNNHTGNYEVHLAVQIVSGKAKGTALLNRRRKRNALHYGYNKRRKKYYFQIDLNGTHYTKGGFKTKDEVIAYRNKFLKEHNLPIPD